MGISQDRILALIAAGEDFRRAGEQLCENIQILVKLNDTGRLTAADIEMLRGLTSPLVLLAEPIDSPAILRAESDHFRLRAGRNARQKRYMAKRRANGGAALVPHTTEDDEAMLLALTTGTPGKRSANSPPRQFRGYNPADDGDPEDAPAAQHFTGLDFISASPKDDDKGE